MTAVSYTLVHAPSANVIDDGATADAMYAVVREELAAGGDTDGWHLIRWEGDRAEAVAAGDELARIASDGAA